MLEEDPAGFAQEMRSACRDVGFFVLAGLPDDARSLHDEVLEVGRQFFALPRERKEAIDYRHSPHFRGYMRLGVENTAGKPDEREQIELGREEPAAEWVATDPLFRRLRGPNQWPDEPVAFKRVVSRWLAEMEALSWSLTRALSSSMGLPATHLDPIFQDHPHVQAKLVHYPVPSGAGVGSPADDAGSGCGAHSDSGFLTLLLQDEVGGLEVLSTAGEWIPATPMRGTLVCNLGEVVQMLSGGEYLSTVHRVRRPPPGGSGRISAPYFWNPCLDAIVQPLQRSNGTASQLASSRRPSSESNRLLASYGMNAFKSLARSHPKVFAQHHPDLRCLPDGEVVAREAQ